MRDGLGGGEVCEGEVDVGVGVGVGVSVGIGVPGGVEDVGPVAGREGVDPIVVVAPLPPEGSHDTDGAAPPPPKPAPPKPAPPTPAPPEPPTVVPGLVAEPFRRGGELEVPSAMPEAFAPAATSAAAGPFESFDDVDLGA